MSLAGGMRLGPYEIVALLGSGGMGEVYRARDTRLARDVAIKVVTGIPDGQARGQVLAEARAAAALNHSNICTIHEIGDMGEQPFIVMECIEGRRLSDLIGHGLPAATATRYGIQIAGALAHAHARGIVHRDLKSANVMVGADGGVKVLDFGLARQLDPVDVETMTRTVAVTGTPAYMAPEALRGDVGDHRVDIWALGVVLYELVEGRRPFGGATLFALSSAILRDEPAPISARIPAPLRLVIQRCLTKEPAHRYQRADEVRAALEAAETLTLAPRAGARKPQAARSSPSARTGIRSIAVLPLDNLSRDPGQEYFADGMTEALIDAVAQIEGLRVISRTSVMRLRGTSKSLPEIARELRVDGVITGSVRQVGDRVRISTRLLNPADESQIWSASYDRDLADVLALETEISRAVADQIALKVSPARDRRAVTARRTDATTYALYLKGRHAGRMLADSTLRQAIACYQEVVARDPQYAPAYAALADAYHWLAFFQSVDPREAYSAAGRAASTAIELDPDLADAHVALGSVKLNFEWDWPGAERAFRRAIELDPNASVARLDYALLLGNLGRLDEAIRQDEIARDLDPLWFGPHQGLAYFAFLLERDDECLAHTGIALQLAPDIPQTHVVAGFSTLRTGRTDDALEHFQRAVVTSGNGSFFLACLAYACATAGDRREAERITDALEERGRTGHISRAALCWPYIALERHDEALRCLQVAYEQHDTILVCLPTFAWWDAIRGTETFREIFARMKFPLAGRQAIAGRSPIAGSTPVAPALAQKPMVVVLPLANSSAEASAEHFCDGMTEDIIAQLSQIGTLRVISRTSAMRYKNATLTAKEIAAALGASHVVEGSVRRAGDRLRVVARLVEATSDAQLWAHTFDRDVSDVFAVQTEVAERVAEGLRAQLSPDVRRRVYKRPTDDQEAYNLYLLARHHWNLGTPESLGKATELCEQAVERDPTFAKAWAALAMGYHWHLSGHFGTRPRDAAAAITEDASRALDLDPDIAEAHCMLGQVAIGQRHHWESGGKHYLRALELSPNLSLAHGGYALYLLSTGRLTEAIEEGERAVELDPAADIVHSWAAWFCYMGRRYDQCLRGLEAAATHFGEKVTWQNAGALIAIGRADAAVVSARKLFAHTPISWNQGHLAWALAAAGERGEARSVLHDLHTREAREYIWPLAFAFTYAYLGEMDRAFDYLERSYEDRVAWIAFPYSPPFDPFRGDARFDALVRRIGAIAPVQSRQHGTVPPEPRPE